MHRDHFGCRGRQRRQERLLGQAEDTEFQVNFAANVVSSGTTASTGNTDNAGTSGDVRNTGNIMGDAEVQRAILMSLQPPAPVITQSQEPADRESVVLLVQMMSCTEEAAERALKMNGHSVEAAVNSLLT